MDTTTHLFDLEAIAPPELRDRTASLTRRVHLLRTEVDKIATEYLALALLADFGVDALKADSDAAIRIVGGDPNDYRLGDFHDGIPWFVYGLLGMTELDDAMEYIADHMHPETLGEQLMKDRAAKDTPHVD